MALIRNRPIIESVNTFNGGLDMDSSLTTIDPNDYPYFIGGEFIYKGTASKIKGNENIPFTSPAGNNTCIGTCEDIQNNGMVYFLYNDQGNHSIWTYRVNIGVIKVLESIVLNFQLAYKIINARVIDGLLYWTDGYDNTSDTQFGDQDFNSPRKINIQKAILFTAQSLTFTDNQFVNGNVMFIGLTNANLLFSVNQQIAVQQNPGYTNASYNTVCTITAITPTTITTDIPWALNSPPNGGTIIGIALPNTVPQWYYGITLQTISWIKYPPTIEPTAIYGTDSGYGKNLFNPANKLCQFQYKWVYDDWEQSDYSPMSALAVPYGDEFITGGENSLLSLLNNVINLTFDTGPDTVRQIVLGVRFGNIGSFGWFITLDKAELGIPDNITNYAYSFYNDRQITIEDQQLWAAVEDFVPQVAEASELMKTDDSTIAVLSQCTEGFDNLTVDIQLWGNPYDLDYLQHQGNNPVISAYTFLANSALIEVVNIVFPTEFITGNLFVYTDTNYNLTYSHIFTQAEINNIQIFYDSFLGWLESKYNAINIASGTNIVWTSSYNINTNQTTFTATDYVPVSVTNGKPNGIGASVYQTINEVNGFKSGAKHLVGIEYGRDEGWEGTVQTANVSAVLPGTANAYGVNNKVQGTEIYIPFLPELVAGGQWFSDNQAQWFITTYINHQPPIWATKYRWVYAGNNTVASFLQFNACNPVNDGQGHTLLSLTPLTDYGVPATSLAAATGINPNSILAYNFTPGDQCRLISQWDTTNSTNAAFNVLYDVKVLAYDASTQLLTIEALSQDIFLNPSTIHNSVLIELYTPATKNQTPIYYELSQTLEIGDAHLPTRYHKPSNTASQVIYGGLITTQAQSIPNNLPCIDFLLNGDVWIKTRWMVDNNGDGGNGDNYINIVEDYNFSDFYISNSYNKGRPNAIDPQAKRMSYELIRNSQKYISNTQINGLSTFLANNFAALSQQNGPITETNFRGFELRCKQWRKLTTIYIGKNQITSPTGENQLITIDAVFGSHNPFKEEWGTSVGTSVCQLFNNEYFWDLFAGKIVRESTNGLFAISDYGISNFIKDLSEAIVNNGVENFSIYSIAEKKYKGRVYFTVLYNILPNLPSNGDDPNLLPNPAYHPPVIKTNSRPLTLPLTFVFYEELNRWKSFEGFYPEMYGVLGSQLFSFQNGGLWKHDSDTSPHNNFYGVQQPTRLTFVTNPQSKVVKNPMGMEIFSNTPWDAANDGDITIHAGTNSILPQISRIKANKFINKKNLYYTAFDRNLNTANLPVGKNPIIDGDVLYYAAMLVTLNNLTGLPTNISKVITNATRNKY